MTQTTAERLPANAPCWCGSGRKYKRCHKPLEGRVQPGTISAARPVPPHIARPAYAETGVPIRGPESRAPYGMIVRPHAPAAGSHARPRAAKEIHTCEPL